MLDEELFYFEKFVIKFGNFYIYLFWDVLLFRWLFNFDYEVYLVILFLDNEKMIYIYRILKKKLIIVLKILIKNYM